MAVLDDILQAAQNSGTDLQQLVSIAGNSYMMQAQQVAALQIIQQQMGVQNNAIKDQNAWFRANNQGNGNGGGNGGSEGGGSSGSTAAHAILQGMHHIAQAAEAFAKNLEDAGNRHLSAGETFDNVLKRLPLGFGGFFSSLDHLAQAADGTSQRLMLLGEASALRTVSFHASGQFGPALTGYGFEAASAGFRADALRGRGALMANPSRGTTYGEEIAYQTAQVRIPAQDRLQTAQADVEAARRADALAGEGVDTTQRRREGTADFLGKRQHALQNEIGAVGSGFLGMQTNADKEALQAARQNVGEAITLQQAAEANAQDAINRKKETSLQLAKAESEVRRANIGVMQGELQIMQQQETRRATAAQALGRMYPIDRLAAVQAIKGFKARGIQGIAPWQREQLRQIAPDLVGKEEERLGEAFAEQHGLPQQLKETFGDKNLKVLREQMAATQFQVRIEARLDEQKLADKVVAGLAGFVEQITVLIDRKIKTLEAEQNRKFQEGRGGG